MLYIANTTEAQAVFIPRNYEGASPEDLAFRLSSTLDHSVPLDCSVIGLDFSAFYYSVALTLPEGVADGEYKYELTGGGQTLATGLLFVGARDRGTAPAGTKQFNENITYKQFDGE